MGQQQLLSLLMVAIITGVVLLRVLATLNAGSADYIHESEIRKHLLVTAANAQAWYRRPAEMGGGGRSFKRISWTRLNIAANTTIAKFFMWHKMQNHFLLVGKSVNDSSLIIKYLVYPDSVVALP